MTEILPILYSFRRCPYAMRARMAIYSSGISVELREVVLSSIPETLVSVSPKGTVPVLILPDNTVIDESIDIVYWALSINDPDNWLSVDSLSVDSLSVDKEISTNLINECDSEFKPWLDKYKYHERNPDYSMVYYREKGQLFLQELDSRLSQSTFLSGERVCVVDIAIFPFVRQFAHVDTDWFSQTTYTHLQTWYKYFMQSELFINVMHKYPPWENSTQGIRFPGKIHNSSAH